MRSSVGAGKIWTALGWLAVALFVAVYAAEFLPHHHGPPSTVRWIRDHLGRGGLIAFNILIVVAFLALLPYRRPTKSLWQSRGAFAAFVIALMTEMFGWPLVLFLLAPLVRVPSLAPRYLEALGHWPAQAGTILSFAGIGLVILGWRRIHRAEGLVTTGVYRLLRHPQYAGLLLFTLGWILHWPSVVTLLLWPVLAAAYVWLARMEEHQATEDFGEAYAAYARRTKRFIPFVV